MYCLSSAEALSLFYKNPREFLLPPNPKVPCKICVLGPPSSGKSTLAALLAEHFNAMVCSYYMYMYMYMQYMYCTCYMYMYLYVHVHVHVHVGFKKVDILSLQNDCTCTVHVVLIDYGNIIWLNYTIMYMYIVHVHVSGAILFKMPMHKSQKGAVL